MRFKLPKLLLIFFLIFLSLSVFSSKHALASLPSFRFSPSTKEAKVGERFDIDIMIDTAGHEVGGAGARIRFNPTFVRVEKITAGQVFADYPAATFNNRRGEATLSGIVPSINQLYKGSGVFGTLTLVAISKGETRVTFDFVPGSTTDSNIAVTYAPGDILEEVENLSLTIVPDETGLEVIEDPDVPDTSAFETPPAKKKGILARILDPIKSFLGFGVEDEEEIDPYLPLPPQDPRTDPSRVQPRFADRDNKEIVMLLLTGLAAIAIIGVIYEVYRRKIKNP